MVTEKVEVRDIKLILITQQNLNLIKNKMLVKT